MKKTVNNASESSYNQTEELSNKADSIQFNNNINSNPINKMTTEKNTLLDIMRQAQEAAGMNWAYIVKDSEKLYCEGISYTLEYDEDCEEEEYAMTVCCFGPTTIKMPCMPEDFDANDERQVAACMWANHEILCNEVRYGSGTLEDKCGIINAIAMQLYHLRAFSPKFYKDNPGFSESFKSLRNYNYAKRRAKEIHAKLQEEGRMY